ncbi:MAG: hypothetical protein AAF722_05300 [Cyanobacteria bacterium P01_C01_bin.70]
MKEILEKRLESLDISKYELAKQLAEKRGKDKPTGVSKLVNKCFAEPDARRYMDLAALIELMGGEIVVRWHSVEENIVSTPKVS